ncbi:DUF1476 family protein [bacterium]|nr:DUF1476 family protein [bacterium]
MSALFEDRERGYENKFAHEQEVMFKIQARANKLFGKWAAMQMQLNTGDAGEYALAVVEAGLKQSGEWDVIAKVGYDLKRKGMNVSETELKDRYRQLYAEADQQIKSE